MQRLKLRPWPFDQDEEVELFWLCSPYFDTDQNWMIKAVFRKKDHSLREVEYPWGTIPYLRLGQLYKNGYLMDSNHTGEKGKITVPNNYWGELCSGFDLPPGLYYFYKKSDYGKQKLWKFNVQDYTYYIPCIELVRSLLTPSKTLANSILKPNGLEFLIEHDSTYGDTVLLELSGQFPSSNANDETVIHLAWLKYNKLANKAWNSVFHNVFNVAIKASRNNPVSQFSKGIPISVFPPLTRGTQLGYRAISRGKNVLILELLGISDLSIPYKMIKYWHPSFKRSETVNEPRRPRNAHGGEDTKGDKELDSSGSGAKTQSNHDSLEMPSTLFKFKQKPKTEKVRTGVQKSRTGPRIDGDEPHKGSKQGTAETTVSTQEPVFGGQVKPIEFKTLEIVEQKRYDGLEDFMKMINFVTKAGFYIQLSLVYIPLGKRISITPKGSRRICAVASIKKSGQNPCYIFEVARPDCWAISTLIILTNDNVLNVFKLEELTSELLMGLLSNNGHWNLDDLNQNSDYVIGKLKHTSNQDPYRWAERVIEKVYLLAK